MKLFIKPFSGFISAVAGALLVVGLFHLTLWGKDSAPNVTVSATPVNRDARPVTSFAPIVKKAAPSVVNISSTVIVRDRARQNPLFSDPRFRQFFGNRFPDQGDDSERSHKAESLGSGVIISPDGYILTANHVVEGADEIEVNVAGSKKNYTAKIIGTDPPTDVAVLKIDATGLPAITLADSDLLEVGDVVLAIGNPFGIGQTVTMGIVSALGRSGLPGFNQYQDFIQTDAAINPGNSGGALVDAEGRLVGINTAIISRSGGNHGVGFAVPIDMAQRVVERLISGGKVVRGLLGVLPQDVTPELAEAFHLPDQNGALVANVSPNSAAEKAGIKSGDVITAFNGKPVTDGHSLRLIISDSAPGSQASVKFIRDGLPKTVTVTLAENREFAGGENRANNPDKDNSTTDALDGVTVADLDNDIRQQLKIPDNVSGAIVSDVDEDSNSAKVGLQKGDVITEINHSPVTDADSAIKLSTEVTGKQILLKIWRRVDNMAVTLWIGMDNVKKDAKPK
jgi:serine protease Do